MYIENELEQRYSREQLYQSGLRVYTSLDLDLQNQAEKIAQQQLASSSRTTRTTPRSSRSIRAPARSSRCWEARILG